MQGAIISNIVGDKTIDAVFIATPSADRIKLIETFVKFGKHRFCEKLITFDENKILRLTKLAADVGFVFQVGFNRRYDVNFMRIKQTVEQGLIGESQIVRITSRDAQALSLEYVSQSGRLYMDFAIHNFDTARFVSGSEVDDVFTAEAVLIEPKLSDYDDIDMTITTTENEKWRFVRN